MNFDLLNLTQDSEQVANETESISSQTYFLSALESSSIILNEYRAATDILYKSLSNNVPVKEAFEDFFKAIDNVIMSFDNSVQKTSNDFVSELMKRTSQDKFIIDQKDLFYNYPIDKGFIMERYKFINLTSNIPKNVAKFNYEKEYGKIEKILSDKYTSNQDKIVAITYEYNSFLTEISQGFYDEYRGKILSMDGTKIRKGEYAEVLFYCFRDRNKIREVRSDDVREAFVRLQGFKKFADQVKTEKKLVEKEYLSIKKDLNRIRFDQLVATFGPDSSQLEAKFDTYIKVKTDQIVNMCNIHMMAYNAKLDAIASCYLQDRSLLLTAMNRVSEPEDEFDVEKNDLGGDL